MNNEYKNDYELILSSFEKIIEKKIQEQLNKNGIEASSYATVVSVDGDNASVKTANSEQVISLKNMSGSTLVQGDNVKIYGSINNMSNRYIGLKL